MKEIKVFFRGFGASLLSGILLESRVSELFAGEGIFLFYREKIGFLSDWILSDYFLCLFRFNSFFGIYKG